MPSASRPGALISLGLDAPQHKITLSYCCNRSDALISLPTFALTTNLIPSFSMTFCLRSITHFSSFIFGMPYISSPPTRSSRSYTVTRWPLRFNWSATARPAGPDPMTATFFPVRTFGGFAFAYPFSYACSIIPYSLSRTVTGSSCRPQVHAASHSAGQTRDVNSGKLLVLCRRS